MTVAEVETLSTPEVAELLGITSNQFLRLAKKAGIRPAGHYTNPYYKSGPPCHLWPADAVEALVDGPEVAAAKARARRQAEGKAAAPKRRAEALARRYPRWQDALAPAAEALFSLNRYAKWRKCSAEHRDEIYDLKNGFIRLLYREGLAEHVGLHQVEGRGLRCDDCGGSGGRGAEECDSCEGSGWYQEPGPLEFLVFRFVIDGRPYCWHQPRELVYWPVELSAPGESWENVPEEKPLEMAPSKFAQAKALIAFVLTQASAALTADSAP
jgi:hypothetical protein